MWAPALGSGGDVISHHPVLPSHAQSLLLDCRQLARHLRAAASGMVSKICRIRAVTSPAVEGGRGRYIIPVVSTTEQDCFLEDGDDYAHFPCS